MYIENDLLIEFNRLCEDIKYRFWVVSPFLGNWNGLKDIIGENIFSKNLDIKLITDIKNTCGIDKTTLSKFIDNGEVKTLQGLHAKIYIIDDKVLVTSANLSETAFCKRYEIGNILDFNQEIDHIFLNWWDKAILVQMQDIKEKEYIYNPSVEGGNNNFLKPLWVLPEKEDRNEEYNYDLLNELRHRIGNTFFVDYYWTLKDESIPNEDIISSLTQYKPDSRKTRVYGGRKIFREGLNIQALDIIRNSTNTAIQSTIDKANEIYLKETTNKFSKSHEVEKEIKFITISGCKFNDYGDFYKAYNELAELYRPFRIWRKSPYYFEIDSFLNFLYHEHPNRPSEKFSIAKIKSFTEVSQSERINMIESYSKQYKLWLDSPQANDNEQNRINRHKIVTRFLDKNNINTLKIEDVSQILNCLNCMTSRRSNIVEFLDLRPNVGNDIISIRRFWNILIHEEENIIIRMHKCEKGLRSFGTSATQELIAFYYPREFPIRNTNVNSGLRLFGYRVSDN